MRSLANKALPGAALVLGLTWAMVGGRGFAGPGDPPPPPPPPDDPLAEPITGVPSTPTSGDETGPIDPFAPPPHDSSDVLVDALTDEEQAYVAAAQDTTGWDETHAGFGAAVVVTAACAKAEAAAIEEGVGGLGMIGVVP